MENMRNMAMLANIDSHFFAKSVWSEKDLIDTNNAL
jgi:hypothetical protein